MPILSASHLSEAPEAVRLGALVSEELLALLLRRFPVVYPTVETPERLIMWRGGNREVVEHLRECREAYRTYTPE